MATKASQTLKDLRTRRGVHLKPGEVPLSIDVDLPRRMKVRLRLSSDWLIKPSQEFTAALEALLGPKAVAYRAGAAPDAPSGGDRRSGWQKSRAARERAPS